MERTDASTPGPDTDLLAVRLVYVTTQDRAQAEAIGRSLVEERLCACVNILAGMRSIYRWQGAVETAEEAVLICKTRVDLEQKLYDRIRALHSYEVPCILSLPVTAGNPDYLAWLAWHSG